MRVVNVENDKMYYVIYKIQYSLLTNERQDIVSGEKLNEMFFDKYIDKYYILNFLEVEGEDK